MASMCSQPVAHSYPDASTIDLGFQFSKPPSHSDAQIFGCAARFNLSAIDVPASMNRRRFQTPPAVGQPLPPACAAELSEDGEIFDPDDNDDDNDLPSVRQILASPKQVIEVIDLTSDDDGDTEGDDGNHPKTTSGLPTNSLCPPSSSLPNSLAHTADDVTTSSAAAIPGKKKYPWKNVPRWSLLYHKLQQRSDKPLDNSSVDALRTSTDSSRSSSTELGPAPKSSRAFITKQPENSPEIQETPVIAPKKVRREEEDHSKDGEEHHGESTQTVAGALIAESSGQTLALTTVSALSFPNLGEGGPVMVDISNFTVAKILNERPSPSGVEYRCELEPLWLAADWVKKAKWDAFISRIIRMISYGQIVWGR